MMQVSNKIYNKPLFLCTIETNKLCKNYPKEKRPL